MDRGRATRIPEIREEEPRRFPRVRFLHNELARVKQKKNTWLPMSNHDHFHDLIQDLNRPRPWTCTIEKRFNDMTCH